MGWTQRCGDCRSLPRAPQSCSAALSREREEGREEQGSTQRLYVICNMTICNSIIIRVLWAHIVLKHGIGAGALGGDLLGLLKRKVIN